MLNSMTGFGSALAETDAYKVSIEVRSVNQRFFELNFRMGHQLAAYEAAMRKEIHAALSRGKVDVTVSFIDRREQAANVTLDENLALSYQQALNRMSDVLRLPRPDDVTAIAAFPDILRIERAQELEGLEPMLLHVLREALVSLTAMRRAEGANIERDFLARLDVLAHFTDSLEALAPEIVQAYRTRIKEFLDELLAGQDIDDTRIVQEMALFADKVNYTEEVVRLRSHFQQFRSMLRHAKAPVGRKLDFLIQEINREANTIGSKANSTQAARYIVDMKGEIEKLREQVQNIE